LARSRRHNATDEVFETEQSDLWAFAGTALSRCCSYIVLIADLMAQVR
jgi:hypothetical protein